MNNQSKRNFLIKSLATALAMTPIASKATWMVNVPVQGVAAGPKHSGQSGGSIYLGGSPVAASLLDGTPVQIDYDKSTQQLLVGGQPAVVYQDFMPFSGFGNSYALFFPPGANPNTAMGDPVPQNAICISVGGSIVALSTDYVPGGCGVDSIGYDLAHVGVDPSSSTQYSPVSGLLTDASGNPLYISYGQGEGGNLTIYGVTPYC